VSRSGPSNRWRVAAIIALSIVTTPAAVTAHHVTIETDWMFYAPGERIGLISGGWRSGETVVVRIVDADSRRQERLFSHVATSFGNFIHDAFVVPEDAMRETFRVIATGAESRHTVETTFEVGCPRSFVATEDCRGMFAMAPCELGCRRMDVPGECHPTASVPAGAGRICGEPMAPCGDRSVCDGWSTSCPELDPVASAADCEQSAVTLAQTSDCATDSAGCMDERRVPNFVVDDATRGHVVNTTVPRGADAGDENQNENCDGALGACTGDGSEPTVPDATPTAPDCGTLDCDDGWACTHDSCDPTIGCRSDPVHARCDDGNMCTSDLCRPGLASYGRSDGCVRASAATARCEAAITDASLCRLGSDLDSGAEDSLRLVFTPTPSSRSSYELAASVPGQFYYNAMYVGPGSEPFDVVLPYPFVTVGDDAVRVYESVALDANGCFVPGVAIGRAETMISRDDYDPPRLGATTSFTVDLPSLPGWFAYVTVRLDYGLEESSGYVEGVLDAAVDASTGEVVVPGQTDYEIRDSMGGGAVIRSENVFKRTSGFAGLVTDALGAPLRGVEVEVYGPGRTLLSTVFTDADGWYRLRHRYRSDPATYTIVLPSSTPIQERTITRRPGDIVVVNFELP
jgi:hypothetical protein